jgi:antitoxin (DNA-binding transcriptional repressor) of toxin-antitoxin stability system
MRGEQVIIGKAGKPVAKLIPFDYDTSPRDLEQGIWQGKVWMAEDFDELPEELLTAFAGEAGDEPANISPHTTATPSIGC